MDDVLIISSTVYSVYHNYMSLLYTMDDYTLSTGSLAGMTYEQAYLEGGALKIFDYLWSGVDGQFSLYCKSRDTLSQKGICQGRQMLTVAQ